MSATWFTAPCSHGDRPTLHNTAIFIGGSKVSAGEAILEAVRKTFFGPFQVSVLFDGNGSNTARAVLTALAASGGSLQGARVLALAATGPVGQRMPRLLGRLGATAAIGSRDLERASSLARQLHSITAGEIIPFDQALPDPAAPEPDPGATPRM